MTANSMGPDSHRTLLRAQAVSTRCNSIRQAPPRRDGFHQTRLNCYPPAAQSKAIRLSTSVRVGVGKYRDGIDNTVRKSVSMIQELREHGVIEPAKQPDSFADRHDSVAALVQPAWLSACTQSPRPAYIRHPTYGSNSFNCSLMISGLSRGGSTVCWLVLPQTPPPAQ